MYGGFVGRRLGSTLGAKANAWMKGANTLTTRKTSARKTPKVELFGQTLIIRYLVM